MNELEEYQTECLLAKIETALTFIQDETIKKEIQQFAKNDGETILLGIFNYLDDNHVFSASKYRHNIYEQIYLEDHRIVQKKIEKREQGIIYTEIEKKFISSPFLENQSILANLVEHRYVYSYQNLEHITGNDLSNLWFDSLYGYFINWDYIKNLCDYVSTFNSYINYDVCSGLKSNTNNPTYTYINGKDVSSLFIIDGPDKLYRIYDLYYGFINDGNLQDLKDIKGGLLSADVYDYKSLIGITKKEDMLAGPPLKEVNDLYYSYLKQIFKERFNYRGSIKFDRSIILNIINPNFKKKKDNKKLKRVLKHIIK